MWSKSMRLKNVALKRGEPLVDLMTNIVPEQCYFRNGESLVKGGNVHCVTGLTITSKRLLDEIH